MSHEKPHGFLISGIVGVILGCAFLWLLSLEAKQPAPEPSHPVISGSQTPAWHMIPDACHFVGEPVSEDCLEVFEGGISGTAWHVVRCQNEDGPGPCLWLDPNGTGLYWVPAE